MSRFKIDDRRRTAGWIDWSESETYKVMHFVRGTSAALFAHGAAVGRPSKDGSVLPASLQHHIHIFYADRVRDVQDACRTLATSPGLWRQRRAGSAVNTKCSFKYSTRRVRHRLSHQLCGLCFAHSDLVLHLTLSL